MTQIAAGWYPDPAGSAQQRYWNGSVWTNDLRPASTAGEAAAHWPPPYVAPNVYGTPDPIRPREQFDSSASDRRQGSPRVFGWALLAFGIVVLFFGVGSLVPAALTSALFGGFSSAGSGAVETSGTVIDLQSQGPDCTPVASFTVDGEAYTAVSSVTYSPCNTALGGSVTISYLPSDISGTAIVAGDSTVTTVVSGMFVAGSVVFGVIGLLMIFGGATLLRRNPAQSAS
jgi:hypothetical protein